MPSAIQGSAQSSIQNAPELTTNSKLSKIKPIVGGAVGGGILATAGVMAYMHHAAIAGAFTTAGKAVIGVGATALGTIGGGAGATLIGALNTFKTFNTRHNSQLTAIQNLNLNDIFEKAEDGRHLKLKAGIDPHQHLYNKYGSMFKSIGGTNYNKLLQSINKNIDKELDKHGSPTDAVSKAIRNTVEGDLAVSQFRKAGTAMAMYIAAGALIGSAVGGSLGAGFGAAPTALIGAACGLGLGIIGAIAAYGVANSEGENIATKANDFAHGLELEISEMGAFPSTTDEQITRTRDVDVQATTTTETGHFRDEEEPPRSPELRASVSSFDQARRNSTPDINRDITNLTLEEAKALWRQPAAAKKKETSTAQAKDNQPESDLMHKSQKSSNAIPQVIGPNAQSLDTTQVNKQDLSKKSPLSHLKDNHQPATTFAGMEIPEGQGDEAHDKGITSQSNRGLSPISTALFRNGSNASSLRTPTPTSATEGSPIFSGQTTLAYRPTNVSGRSIESSRGVMDSISRAGSIASVKTSTHRPSTSRREQALSTVFEEKRSSAGSDATIKEGGSTTSALKRDFSFVGRSQDNIEHGLFSVPERLLNNLQRERKAREARESSSSRASVEPTRSQTLPLTFGEFIKSEASESGSQKIHALFDKQIKQHASLEGFVSNLSKDEYRSPRTLDPKEQLLLDAFHNFNLKDPEGNVQARNALNHLLEM